MELFWLNLCMMFIMVQSKQKKTKGIKLKPLIGKHHIHKDFDTKIALKNTIRDNDFLIVAGDADNDKEALNIFIGCNKIFNNKLRQKKFSFCKKI